MIMMKTKKPKGTKKCVIKRKLKFVGYKNRLEAIQLEIKQTIKKKNKTDIDSLKEDHEEFTKAINSC